jgi:hypothetical protein
MMITEASKSVTGLDDSGSRQLEMFVAILRNVVKRHRQLHLARISEWKNRIQEDDKLSQAFDKFRFTIETF